MTHKVRDYEDLSVSLVVHYRLRTYGSPSENQCFDKMDLQLNLKEITRKIKTLSNIIQSRLAPVLSYIFAVLVVFVSGTCI